MFSLIFGGIGVGLLVCGMVPARLAGRVPDVELLMGSIAIPIIGSAALLAGFLLDAPIGYTLPVLFVTIVPLSVMGAASAIPMGVLMLAGYTLGGITFLTLVYPDHRRGGKIMMAQRR